MNEPRAVLLAVSVTAVLLAAACGSTVRPELLEPSASSTSEPDSQLDGSDGQEDPTSPAALRTGAAVIADRGFDAWSGLRVGLIANRASVVGDTHLADLIHADPDVELVALFGPEHGVRTDVPAGEFVDDSVDATTGVPVFSLYGETRQPPIETLAELDLLVYDLQDVGARYFTFISTMGLAMQAAAEAGIPFVVLDRPNPLGDRVAGFVRDPDVDSFVAAYPVPDTYGLTAGELASAIQGERWLPGLDSLDLQVVELEGWDPASTWLDNDLPWIPPSPALTTPSAALAYPALVYFEATTVSVGRDSEQPFERFSAPFIDAPALSDRLNERRFPGFDFEPLDDTTVGVRVVDTDVVQPADTAVHLLAEVLALAGAEDALDRPDFLDVLAGGPTLRTRLAAGDEPADIVADRQADLDAARDLLERYRRY